MAEIIEKQYGSVKVVRNRNYQYGVTDFWGNVIVPFGKYAWIDGFDQGLARVRTYGRSLSPDNVLSFCSAKQIFITDRAEIERLIREDYKNHPEVFQKWGIIDENGKEVLPAEYDNIWNFLGKGRYSTNAVKDEVTTEVYFNDLNPSAPKAPWLSSINSVSYEPEIDYFAIQQCYDYEGYLDYDRLEDAIMDGEFVPDDW